MRLTIETVDGARFVRWQGITRFIWLPRHGRASTLALQGGILVVALFGYCAVLAPFRPKLPLVVLFVLSVLFCTACASSPLTPTPPATVPELQGAFVVSATTHEVYAKLGDWYPFAVTGGRLVLDGAGGPLTVDTTRADGRRHVEVQHLSTSPRWAHLEPSRVGIQCDLYPEKRAGWCALGISDAWGNTTVQGEVKF